MIEITPSISIDESEIAFDFVRSSGPGGQNVNKVATAVQLRFDVLNSPSLDQDVKDRLVRKAGARMTGDGILLIDAHRYRTQEQNRQDALERLVELVRKAAEKPKLRKRTRPTLASQQERLERKRQRSETKKLRHRVED
jgi:ribosome-associated protein